MRKLFVFTLCLVYWLASSTLAHSFCIQEDKQETVAHGCCDWWEVETNCYENCLSDISNLVQPDKITEKLSFKNLWVASSDIWFWFVLEERELLYYIYPPPDDISDWCDIHVGTTKKLE